MPFSGSGTGISNADDVFFSSVSDGDTLLYNSGTAKWNNAAAALTGTGFHVANWNGTNFRYNGTDLTARPSIDAFNDGGVFIWNTTTDPTFTTYPQWAIAGDWWIAHSSVSNPT